MDDCCEAKNCEIGRMRESQARVLQVVLAINAAMFVAEFTAGAFARSTALMADSVDMFGDAAVYALSLYALNRGARWRAGAAFVKGAIILAFGIWILIEAVLSIIHGVTPRASVMGAFGFLALAANLTCLLLLWGFRRQDINMRSTFECSRNDVIANLGVLVAAAGVWATGAGWPDIIVGLTVATLFIRSAVGVLREAYPLLTGPKGSGPILNRPLHRDPTLRRGFFQPQFPLFYLGLNISLTTIMSRDCISAGQLCLRRPAPDQVSARGRA